MIDTVVLTLRDKEFRIFDSSHFQSRSQSEKLNLRWSIYNPDIKKEGYRPRLTYTVRFGVPELRVEFSAPKLLFDNNFDELENSHFEPLIQKLHSSLFASGVETYPFYLKNGKGFGNPLLKKYSFNRWHYERNDTGRAWQDKPDKMA